MGSRSAGRRFVAGFVMAVVGVGGAVVWPATPVHAGASPLRFEAASAHDETPVKTVTVTCTGQRVVFAPGGRTVGGDGGVVLTAVVPDADLTSVTVSATARSGHQGAWSLRAYAVCDLSTSRPERITAIAHSAPGVMVECPGRTRLFGAGFRMGGPVDHAYVNEVSIGPDLRQARVHTGGPGTPTSVTVYGICKEPTQPAGPPGVRVEATDLLDPTGARTVTASGSTSGHRMYGVGAAIRGSGQHFLSALVPDLDQDLAVVTAVRAAPLGALAGWSGPAVGPVADGADSSDSAGSPDSAGSAGYPGLDDGGSVTVFGVEAGTFH